MRQLESIIVVMGEIAKANAVVGTKLLLENIAIEKPETKICM